MTHAQLNNEFSSYGTLQSYAAEAAINVLSANWADALFDGAKLDVLLSDVDVTIQYLQEWRNNVTAHCPAQLRAE